MRRRYRYNPKTKEMEEVRQHEAREWGVLVCADIEPFKSIVDGSVISGRAGLREHNRRNNVTFTEDYKDEWKGKACERERMFSGDPSYDKKRRVEAVRKAVEKHESRRR